MNPIKRITLLLVALTTAGVLRAQQGATSYQSTADRPGVLGQNFTELSFGMEDLRRTSDHAYDANLRANVPVSPNVDVGLGYGYSWLNGDEGMHSHLLAADSKFYAPLENHMKPYIGGLVGYQWARTDFDNQFPVIRTHDNRWVWGLSTGIEIPVGTVALTPRIGYIDTMENNSVGHYNYGVEAHHWFTQSVGGYADVSYNELRHEANTWTYLAGMRLRF